MRVWRGLTALAIVLAAAAVLSGCCCGLGGLVSTGSGALPGRRIIGSRTMSSRSYDMAGFTGVGASSAFTVEIFPSAEHEVTVTANENILDYVQVNVVDGVLELGLQTGYSFSRMALTARVGLPTLEFVSLSGASCATLDGEWEAARFEAHLSGASNLQGNVVADEMSLGASGASRIELDGAATRLEADGSGASTLDLGDLIAGEADISLSGASNGVLDVTERLDVRLTGASTLRYGGSPVVSSDVSGGSTLRKR